MPLLRVEVRLGEGRCDGQGDTRIAPDDDVARLLAKCEAEPARARKYANLVLDIDPDNAQALRYL